MSAEVLRSFVRVADPCLASTNPLEQLVPAIVIYLEMGSNVLVYPQRRRLEPCIKCLTRGRVPVPAVDEYRKLVAEYPVGLTVKGIEELYRLIPQWQRLRGRVDRESREEE